MLMPRIVTFELLSMADFCFCSQTRNGICCGFAIELLCVLDFSAIPCVDVAPASYPLLGNSHSVGKKI